jgi:hypothetical protein
MTNLDFLFIQFYIKKKYSQKVEEYFNIGKQSISDWRNSNLVPSKRLLEFYQREGTLDLKELFGRIYKID